MVGLYPFRERNPNISTVTSEYQNLCSAFTDTEFLKIKCTAS